MIGVVIVPVVVPVIVVPAALAGLRVRGAAVELHAVYVLIHVDKVREERGDSLVILARVGVGPEVLVQEGVDFIGAYVVGEALAYGEPAAVLLHNVEQEHAVIGGFAAYAPVVEKQPGVLLAVIAARQVVYSDYAYLRTVALLLKRSGGEVDELLCALGERPGVICDVKVVARLHNAVRGERAASDGKGKYQRKERGKQFLHTFS